MMNIFRIPNILFSVLLIFLSTQQSLHPSVREQQILVPVDTLKLEIDAFTPNITTSIEYLFNYEGIAILSKGRYQKILIYDYSSEKLLQSIDLKGLPPNAMGFKYINDDTIFVHYHYPNKVFMVNINTTVVREVTIENDTVESRTWTPSPMIYFNQKLYLAGSILGEYSWEKRKRRPVLTEIDYKTGTINYLLDYPDIYKTNNWGGTMFRMIYDCYNPNTKRIILSFPLLNKLVSYDTKNNKTTYVNGKSEVYTENIKPLSGFKEKPTGINAESRHFVENNSYAHILFDRWRNIYYRIMEIKGKYTGGKFSKAISVIILDRDFNYKGETRIQTKNFLHPMWRYSVFVSPGGLNLQLPSDEDHFSFVTYSLR